MMKQHQDEDASIQKMIKRTDTDRYTIKEVEGVFLVHDHNRILVPMSMRDKVLQWYHLLQRHPGGGEREWRRQHVLSILGKVYRLM